MSTTTSRQTEWRKKHPEKATAQQERSSLSRKERIEQDPEYAEKIRQAAREAQAEKARKAREGAPDGWKVIVRLKGEKRGRALLDIVYTPEGKIRGLKRKQAVSDVPKAYDSLADAQQVCADLLRAFPSRVEQAYPVVA